MVVVYCVNWLVCFGGEVVDSGCRGMVEREKVRALLWRLRERARRNGEQVICCLSDNRKNFKVYEWGWD